ncbi:MAG TPA: ArdC-like ssDNA-binding domain-containing protein [Candidatus Saccharimonadales bacterium]|nr:ArdC-like ssDNA-binding domain-containing protein [Candidatus Saccharimonadales bacterium]
MRDQSKWQELLVDAVNQPGKIMSAYAAFHNYSIGNALLALSQCLQRNLTPGPLNTYKGWQELGRYVKKDERALTLCMPVSSLRKRINPKTKQEDEYGLTYFVYRPFWFALCQTEGDKPYALETPGFDLEVAISGLGIGRIEFDMLDGNTQGFAKERTIGISPIAQLPLKTTFHELAHVVLNHTAERSTIVDEEFTPRSLREVEAEATALICLEALGLEGSEYCRGYIQHWLQGGKEIPTQSAQKILAAATTILKAGRTVAPHNRAVSPELASPVESPSAEGGHSPVANAMRRINRLRQQKSS